MRRCVKFVSDKELYECQQSVIAMVADFIVVIVLLI